MTTARISAPARRAEVRAKDTDRVPVLQRPLASYYLLLVSIGLLVVIGFVMVLSASSVRSYSTYGSSYTIALKQAMFIAIGLPLLWVASRLPVKVWRTVATPLLALSVAMLVVVLVPGIGHGANGARRWIPVAGSFTVQPSELAKLGLLLWGADLLVRKQKLLRYWKHLVVPLVPVAAFVAVLVMLEPDLGTTIVTMSVVLTLLWVVGTPMRVFAALTGAVVGLGSLVAITEPYRLRRLVSFTDPCGTQHRLHDGFQACQGMRALTSGGLFGRGLGASTEKWTGGLPKPYTDFVYAIVGEELGLLGTLAVLLLFATMTYAGIRVAKRTRDPFVRLAAAGITVWITAQAMVNIGTVVGLLPVTGIPLPLVSYGGSALVLNLLALGLLVSFARTEPGAEAALQARRGWLRGLLRR